jgi:hypothetical protein
VPEAYARERYSYERRARLTAAVAMIVDNLANNTLYTAQPSEGEERA